jgi:hypothetical protein
VVVQTTIFAYFSRIQADSVVITITVAVSDRKIT